MPRKPTDIVQVNLRIPESLRRTIEKKAKESGLTMNAQLIRMIESVDAAEDQMRELRERITELESLAYGTAIVPEYAAALLAEFEELRRQVEAFQNRIPQATMRSDEEPQK
jgi:polyhydroxyalkanoate synthesis regulator phasin